MGIYADRRASFMDRRVVEINGIKWFLRDGESIDDNIRKGTWERRSSIWVNNNIADDHICFDIGANIGYYTVLLANKAKYGFIYAFEPMREAFNVAEKHVELNNLDNVNLYNIGLGDVSTNIINKFEFSWNKKQNDAKPEEREIQVLTLDEFVAVNGVSRIDFMKLDVDGYELKILRGALQALKRFKPVMLLEVCDYTLLATEPPGDISHYRSGDKVRELYSFIERLGIGYEFYYLPRKGLFSSNKIEGPVQVEKLLADYDLSERSLNMVVTTSG